MSNRSIRPAICALGLSRHFCNQAICGLGATGYGFRYCDTKLDVESVRSHQLGKFCATLSASVVRRREIATAIGRQHHGGL
jgi:hypothetical protein